MTKVVLQHCQPHSRSLYPLGRSTASSGCLWSSMVETCQHGLITPSQGPLLRVFKLNTSARSQLIDDTSVTEIYFTARDRNTASV